MNCGEAKTRWHRRFDDGGPDDALDKHLVQCSACREYAGQMQRLCSALDRIRDETEGMSAPAILAQPPSRRRRAPWIVRPAPWLAAAAAIALAFIAYRSVTVERERPPAIRPIATVDEPLADAPALGITLQGESRSRLLAVAAVTGDPNVQLYRLYPRLSAVDEGPQSTASP